MTPTQDRRATTVQEETWHRTPAYADLLAALDAFGYASYAEARHLRSVAKTDAERQRYHDFEADWTRRMVERVGLARDQRTSLARRAS